MHFLHLFSSSYGKCISSWQGVKRPFHLQPWPSRRRPLLQPQIHVVKIPITSHFRYVQQDIQTVKSLDVFSTWYSRISNNQFKAPKNQARGNRKTLKRPKVMLKINLRNLKLKSHEEYLICRTYFVYQKTRFSS